MRRIAFTLIELLVVIAIIAILAAILFPVFAQAKAAAKKTADLSNIKNISLASPMYMGDYDDVYIMLRNGSSDWGCSLSGGYPCEQVKGAYQVVLNPYVKNRQVFQSPQDSLAHNDCPGGSLVNTPGGAISYGFSYNDPNNSLIAYGVSGWRTTSSSINGTTVTNPADTIVLIPLYCTWSYWNGFWQHRADQRWYMYSKPEADRIGLGLDPTGCGTACFISAFPVIDNYGGAWCDGGDAMSMQEWSNVTNFGFADGHAKAMKRQSTLDPMWISDPVNAKAQGKKNLVQAVR